MKREIKFRAWDGDEMRETFSVQSNGDGINYAGDIMNSWILMQYTGLKDKNGVEIYEGDIVKVCKSDFGKYDLVTKIIWGVKGGWHPEGTHCDNLQEYLTDIHGKNVSEVIGNVYEHPELLK